MKKKTFALCGLAALAGLSLVSCGGNNSGNKKPDDNIGDTPGTDKPGTDTPELPSSSFESQVGDDWKVNPNRPEVSESTRLDVYVNYKGKSGVAARKGFSNPMENNTQYAIDDLLPAWKAYQTYLGNGVQIKDATTYGQGGDDSKVYSSVDASGYVSEAAPGEKIDLFYNSTSNINKMGNAGKAVNLVDYMDLLPNFRKYLQENPAIEEEITYGSDNNRAIYYTPYLDGYNTVERLLVMDTNLVEKLLDNDVPTGLGQIKSGKGGHEKTVKEAKYQPFIDANYNYAADTTVDVLKNGAKAQIQIKKTDNIIKTQNAKLANGVTGAEMISDFKAYLTAAFGHEVGEGKTYSKLSEIFTSESAAYNADELIALMRVMKANPDVLYNTATEAADNKSETAGWKEVEALFPRGLDNSRINNMIQFAGCVWGVQGMGAESGHLYYNAEGKLMDAETTQQSYDMLDNLAAIYAEGLMLDDFFAGAKNGTINVGKYFTKNNAESSYGLLMFDYCATQSAPNDYKDGLGTKPDARMGVFKDTSVTGVRPILAPLSYWATKPGFDHTATLGSAKDRESKELIRYYEENRAVKTNSWCIPTSSDNYKYALKLMDYMFTTEGNLTQNFGPAAYRTTTTLNGITMPSLKQEVLNWYATVGGDIWDFYRGYLGTTQGIGHVRPTELDIASTNFYAKDAYAMIKVAMDNGVVAGAKCRTEGISWDACVRTSCYPVIDEEVSVTYDNITSFWANDKLKENADGWVKLVVEGGSSFTGNVGTSKISATSYTLAQLKAQFTAKNTSYLYSYAESVGSWAIPSFTIAE